MPLLRFKATIIKILIALALILAVYLGYRQGIAPTNWGLYSTIIILFILLGLYRWSQAAAATSKEITLIAALAGVAAIGRVPFAALPSVQPTTFLVICAGYVFGPRAGFIVGATAALVSNFFLGQGPWTPWQMMGWGLVGCTAAYLNGLRPNVSRLGIALFAGLWGFVFGWMQNLGFWLVYVQPLTFKSFLAAYAASFFFDLTHALTNFLLSFLFFHPVIRIMEDYKQRLEYSYTNDQSS